MTSNTMTLWCASVVDVERSATVASPADADEGVYFKLLEVPEELLRVFRLLQWICAGCAEYGPAERKKTGDRPPVELDCLCLYKPPPAFPYARELVPKLKAPFDHGPYDGVKPRTIAPACQNPNVHHPLRFVRIFIPVPALPWPPLPRQWAGSQ